MEQFVVDIGPAKSSSRSRGLVGLFATHGAKGRRIESQSLLNFFVHPIGRGGLAKKKRKSTKVSQNKEMREPGSGKEKKEKPSGASGMKITIVVYIRSLGGPCVGQGS